MVTGVRLKAKRRLRKLVGVKSLALARRFSSRVYVGLDYAPTSANTPRYGYGHPQHDAITSILSRYRDRYQDALRLILLYRDQLTQIPLWPTTQPSEPHWLNFWQPGLDIASIYAFVASRSPRRYIEIGSGISTMVAARAKRDYELTTEIVSIDPKPRAGIDSLCNEILRKPLESVGRQVFSGLQKDDVVFFDGSHRVFQNSDVVAFYLDVLPSLPDGVLVGIHDILWPDDYLPEWADYYYSEQYLLAAYLLAECRWMSPILASNYVSQDIELKEVLAPLWESPSLAGVAPHGFSFWLEIDRSNAG